MVKKKIIIISTHRGRITFAWIWGLTGITFAWRKSITIARNKIFVLIYISYICICVILIFFVFILKTDERGE
jgi:CHASE2 domain-containing sensor protein